MPANENRNNSISIAKGIGIILMVLGHTHFSKYGNAWVSMVHMPLFFFFSGYCFKEKYIGDFYTFFLKRVKGLYLPAVKWGLLFLVLHNVFFHLNLYDESTSYIYSGKVFITKACYIVATMTHFEQLLGGYWFMRSLFWCSIIGFFVIKYIPQRYGIVALLLISVFLLVINKNVPYFSIGAREMIASLIFVCGYRYRKSNYKLELSWYIYPIAIVIVTIGSFFWWASMGWFQSMTWWKVTPWVITAFFGIIAIYALSIKINNSKRLSPVFTFIGEHTLGILTWHLLLFKLVSLTIVMVYHLDVSHMAEFPVIETYSPGGWWIAYLIIGCGVPLLFVIIKSYAKRFISKRYHSQL